MLNLNSITAPCVISGQIDRYCDEFEDENEPVKLSREIRLQRSDIQLNELMTEFKKSNLEQVQKSYWWFSASMPTRRRFLHAIKKAA